jgi:hypothetical protein
MSRDNMLRDGYYQAYWWRLILTILGIRGLVGDSTDSPPDSLGIHLPRPKEKPSYLARNPQAPISYT